MASFLQSALNAPTPLSPFRRIQITASRGDELPPVRELPYVEWHAVGSDFFHNNRICDIGNNIEPWNAGPGDGGKRQCQRCIERLGLAALPSRP